MLMSRRNLRFHVRQQRRCAVCRETES